MYLWPSCALNIHKWCTFFIKLPNHQGELCVRDSQNEVGKGVLDLLLLSELRFGGTVAGVEGHGGLELAKMG